MSGKKWEITKITFKNVRMNLTNKIQKCAALFLFTVINLLHTILTLPSNFGLESTTTTLNFFPVL